jgi:hypothetical protein
MPFAKFAGTLVLALVFALRSVAAFADEELTIPLEPGTVVAADGMESSADDGMVIVPPGAMLPLDPQAVLVAPQSAPIPNPIIVEQPLFANGLVVPAGYQCPSEGHCGVPCVACRQAQFTGWSAAVDLMIFQPIYAGGDMTIVHPDGGSESSDVSVGPRVMLRHEHAHGGGLEARFSGIAYEELLIRDSAPYYPTISETELRTFQFDFDLTQRFWIGDSSVVMGVGPRAASLSMKIGDDPELSTNTGGVGVSAMLDRPFYRSSLSTLSLIGFGRASLMGGNIQIDDTTAADGTMSILEAGFGVELRRKAGRGDFVGRIMMESQWWESNMMAPIYFDGPTVRLGYQW